MGSSPLPRSSSSKPTRLSPFFRDLASPISSHHRSGSRFASPGQAATISALWRESIADDVDPPPPPMYTLDDRAEFSPEPGLGDLPPPSPVSPTGSRSRTPLDRRGSFPASPSLSSSSFVLRSARGEPNTSGVADGRAKSPESSSRAGPSNGVREDWGKRPSSPVDGVDEQGVLMTLLKPELARPRLQRNGTPNGGINEEWVTVFGFCPGDTNFVLREFEKCGKIAKHAPGPSEANWIHILYQNGYDARKALEKNGKPLNSQLMIGVKPIDPMHCCLMSETLENSGHGSFMVSLSSKSVNGSGAPSSSGAFSCPNHSQTSSSTITDSGRCPKGAIASPARSIVSEIMDLMFGI